MFPSHRSVVMAMRGMVATSHPLAAVAGLQMMRWGGSAVDAAVATAVMLNVVEPMSTGIGGDMFALIYDSQKERVHALNGSGRSGEKASWQKIRGLGFETMPEARGLSVSVPGAVDGWLTLLEQFGRLPLSEVLSPAIYYAEIGFPVSPVIAGMWKKAEAKLRQNPVAAETYLIDGRAPKAGEIFRQPHLAETLQLITRQGREAFYRGRIADKIVEAVKAEGGLLTGNDLNSHKSDWDEPIEVAYQGYRLLETPPNGQGIVALQALGILQEIDFASKQFGQADVLHYQIEAIKLGFADAYRYVADPRKVDLPIAQLLNKDYLVQRRSLIDPQNASPGFSYGNPLTQAAKSDTVYLTVVDGQKDGLAVSFINSIFHAFGSGIVVPGTGICLQNRAALFSLEADHPNVIAPGKRPYHTIIPAMLFKEDNLVLCFGVMGGFMQPQGHVQVVNNIVDFGIDVQQALDAPRFRWVEGATVEVEAGFDPSVLDDLRQRGHNIIISDDAESFGGGQIIRIDVESGVLFGGSEPRKDGLAVGF